MRHIRLLVAALVLLGAAVVPARAITNGSPDGEAHPSVGGLVSPVQYSDGTWLYCSGTLVSPTVFVTAAHCADDGATVRVTFAAEYTGRERTHGGVFHAHPAYGWSQNDPADLAVVVFDRAVRGIAPSRLPGAGSLGSLPAKQKFTSVGYGAYEVQRGPGGHRYLYNDVRMAATGTLNAVNASWLRISMNAALGNGGTCYGDSGGPNFLGDSDTIASITVTGDAICRSTNVTYRLDTVSARDFLSRFAALP
jgi:secreted trypsin-like serine protease